MVCSMVSQKLGHTISYLHLWRNNLILNMFLMAASSDDVVVM